MTFIFDAFSKTYKRQGVSKLLTSEYIADLLNIYASQTWEMRFFLQNFKTLNLIYPTEQMKVNSLLKGPAGAERWCWDVNS